MKKHFHHLSNLFNESSTIYNFSLYPRLFSFFMSIALSVKHNCKRQQASIGIAHNRIYTASRAYCQYFTYGQVLIDIIILNPKKVMNSLDSQNNSSNFSPIFSYVPTLPQTSPLFTSKNNSLYFFSVIAPFTLETLLNIQELDSPSFETRIESSIIIKGLSDLSNYQESQAKQMEFQPSSWKVDKKVPQKESRNVSSNLLRIFLKNLIELKFFDALISQIILSHNSQITLEQFHLWLSSFSINFKNYIRFKQVRQLYRDNSNPHMSSIFRTILRHYTKSFGINHILSSRRIQCRSLMMHLNGLRQLSNQLYNL